MKILYAHYLNDPDHPAVQMVQNITEHLRAFGHEVLIHPTAGYIEKTPGGLVKVRPGEKKNGHSRLRHVKNRLWFAKAMARNWNFLSRDREAIDAFNPDVVISRQDAYCWSMTKAAKEASLPVVTYADAPVAYDTRLFNPTGRWHPQGLIEKIEKDGLNASDAIIAVSNPAAEVLRQYDLSRSITVNPNGIDPSRFLDHSDGYRKHIKKMFGIDTEIVIGFQGNFQACHGTDRLKDLIVWSHKYPNVTWLLVGDGPERRTLQEEVRGKARVIFAGRQDPIDMPRYLAAMDIAVAPPAQMDGPFYFCPIKLLEFAASRCATLASSQGDIPFMLADGAGGEIVHEDTTEAWTRGLARLIENEELRKQIGRTARDHVIQNLTWENTASCVDMVISNLTGSQPLAAPPEVLSARSRDPEEASSDQRQLVGV